MAGCGTDTDAESYRCLDAYIDSRFCHVYIYIYVYIIYIYTDVHICIHMYMLCIYIYIHIYIYARSVYVKMCLFILQYIMPEY